MVSTLWIIYHNRYHSQAAGLSVEMKLVRLRFVRVLGVVLLDEVQNGVSKISGLDERRHGVQPRVSQVGEFG